MLLVNFMKRCKNRSLFTDAAVTALKAIEV
jgi:hypothetical protein